MAWSCGSTPRCAWRPDSRAPTCSRNVRTTRIEWCDCDPAGIIFYPRYFEIFDTSDHCAHRTRAGHEQDRISQGLRFRRASGGGDACAFSSADPVRRRHLDRNQARRMRRVRPSSSSTGSAKAARLRSRASRRGSGRNAMPAIRTHIQKQPIPAEVVARLSKQQTNKRKPNRRTAPCRSRGSARHNAAPR